MRIGRAAHAESRLVSELPISRTTEPPARFSEENAPLRRRIRNYAITLAATLWATILVNLAWPGVRGFSGHLKGEDFAHFYLLGRLVRDGRVDLLYDTVGQAAYLQTIIPGAPLTYFVPVYGPQVPILYRPFAFLPYLPGFVLWSALTIALCLWSCRTIWRRCPNLQGYGTELWVLAIASPALWQLVLFGQNSAVALACLTGGWLLLRSHRPLLAGLVLGLLFYKPQLALATIVVLLCTLRWNVLVMMAVSAAGQMLGAAALLGVGAVADYFRMLTHLGEVTNLIEPKLYQMYSFRAFFQLLGAPATIAVATAVVCSVIVLIAVVRHFRTEGDPDMSFALLLLATVLVSPHTTVYDLVLTLPALVVFADRLFSRTLAAGRLKVQWALLAALFLLPLGSQFAQFLHLQPMVICMTAAIASQCLVRTRRTEIGAAPAFAGQNSFAPPAKLTSPASRAID